VLRHEGVEIDLLHHSVGIEFIDEPGFVLKSRIERAMSQ